MNKAIKSRQISKSAMTSPPPSAWMKAEIQTPSLVLDLDALERNIKKMGDYAKAHGMRHRVHGKDAQVGRCGPDCRKAWWCLRCLLSEGVRSRSFRPWRHQGRSGFEPGASARPRSTVWHGCPKLGARTICCVDDLDNVADLSAAAQRHGTQIECLVEIDCGAGRCGVTTTPAVVEIAKAIDAAPGLKFAGIQAYQGAMQHMDSYEDRKAKIALAVAQVKDAVDTLKADGIECDIVGGGGTGSYYFESTSGVYNELQCGSYAFMDADYGRILDKDGKRIDQGEWENALFILTTVMSHAKADKAIVDAGLKAQSVDSGLPVIFGRDDVEYVKCSDEHGVVADPDGVLKVNDKLQSGARSL